MNLILLSFIVGFVVALVLAPLIIKFAKKAKASQTILHYVESHAGKSGTPTMGGIIFILPILFVPFIFFGENFQLGLIAIVVTLAYGVLGFLDDFIKVKFKQNRGLRAYQKIVGQFGIAVLLAIFVYTSPMIGTTLYIPFTMLSFDIGIFIIPLIILTFIAITNAANLTDGLDGLAGGVSFVAVAAFSAVILIVAASPSFPGGELSAEYSNLATVGAVGAGAILAFLMFNWHPAKIFMGDTGSLALGGLIACLAVFSLQTLLLPIICITFVLSAVSVSMQVLYFKKTKKRIFLMAPIHHHFEKKGVHETKIAAIYIIATILVSVLVIAVLL